MGHPGIFLFIFGLFQTNINTIFKNVHTVYCAGIKTHNFYIESLMS